ncbi:hypothetical protein Tsubulata_020129 [Turnera subulata]|uniref:Nuclear speckle splicing regulatory protein 1 N-terminal domain-containing protein n=1 Tax=Turnera subulata TaxID=218843 RepID=A0A9Q0G4Z5_9ROSI|nr:hypothetical protein Tsubulata_020129 [Turnera subulata]
MDKKYGLQLRKPPAQQKKPPRPPVPKPLGFGDDDDDDVEKEILRQASKNKSLKDIEEQHKKALEEDPSVFDYDGVYDEMKQKSVLPKAQDRGTRKPKYIETIMKKAEERKREQEIVYERKLAKERSKEDHLFAEKDKYITSAYKKKLAEKAQWEAEERLRQLREERDDVTKKKDLSDFYFNLGKNVAFGAKDIGSRKHEKEIDLVKPEEQTEFKKPEKQEDGNAAETSYHSRSSQAKERHQVETSSPPRSSSRSLDQKPVADEPVSNASSQPESSEKPSAEQPKVDHHKRNQDALAAARERFLARKKAKEQ